MLAHASTHRSPRVVTDAETVTVTINAHPDDSSFVDPDQPDSILDGGAAISVFAPIGGLDGGSASTVFPPSGPLDGGIA